MTQVSLPQFPLPRSNPLNPPDAYAFAREQDGLMEAVLWNGRHVWLVTRHVDVREVLRSPAFSADPNHENYPFIYPSLETILRNEEPTILSMDGVKHNDARRMLQAMFTTSRMAQLRPRVEELVDNLLDHIAEGPVEFDFHAEFALVIPSQVIAELLGVPYDYHDLFQRAAAARTDLNASPSEVTEAGNQIAELLTRIIEDKLHLSDPADDLLGRLVSEQIRPGNATVDDVVVMARLILQAGHDSTSSTISMGALVLLQHPDEVARIRSDPTLVPGAVEEILRFTGTAQYHSRRVAIEDIVIGGQLIKAGDGVLALMSSANRDPAVFEDPDRFDIHRDARQHMAFSDGIHQCLGQHLARLELNVIFSKVFGRFPGLRMTADLPTLEFRTDRRAYGVHRLPVARE